jgi:succinyl-CoA synthetase alpha subunit
MPILVAEATTAVVQGITGAQGSFHTSFMLEYGTKITGGVTPGKGGTTVHGVPVYDTLEEAIETAHPTSSMIFVPAPAAKDAALEAVLAGLNPVVAITEGMPVRDSMQVMAVAKQHNVTIIGPNTPGIITPRQCKLGIMPGHIFMPGPIGVVSRSGTLTYEIAAGLTNAGLGQSTCLGLGGDPIVGLDFIDVLEMFRNDRETKAVVMIGEIGGNAEEQAADYIRRTNYPLPVFAYIAGRAAPPGKRMGHAGAIVMGRSGTAQTKLEALQRAGVFVALKPGDIARNLKEHMH